MASRAAFKAIYFGMTNKASANSAITDKSLLVLLWAIVSKKTETPLSTAPPPATTYPDSNVLFNTHNASCIDLSTSSK